MRNKIFAFLSVFGLVVAPFLTITAVSKEKESEARERKIVVFKDGRLNEQEKDSLIEKKGGVKVKDLKSIRGKAVLLDKKGKEGLEKDENILRIDDDIIVEALNKKNPNVSQSGQILPWGVDRIDAELVWGNTTANIVKVAVIDTGIDLKHPDLKNNIKGGINTINPKKNPNDDNGHGTHVAGTIGAINNSIGVVGVGPNIDLYAIKALNRNGSGFLSDIIEGIDWAIKNKMQVINMSLGTRSNIQSFHDAVIAAYNAGIVVVAAAGNDNGGAVNFPAAYPEAIAVSASGQNDNIASFSSIGPEVDFAAPGVSILSTYRDSSYATGSGTSMASPHVAGVAALVLSVPQKCDTDLNGTCSPNEVKTRMAQTAEDLGAPGFDNFYGNGLVNALQAVTQ